MHATLVSTYTFVWIAAQRSDFMTAVTEVVMRHRPAQRLTEIVANPNLRTIDDVSVRSVESDRRDTAPYC